MNKFKKIQLFRTITQIVFLIFLPGLITLAFSQAKTLLENIFTWNFNGIISNSIVFVILAVLTMLAGRVFCGWLCIFGSLNDWTYKITNEFIKKKNKVPKEIDESLKYLKYLILLLIMFFVWTGIASLPEGSSPWDAYSQITDIGFMIKEYTIGTVILIAILIGSTYIERFYCRYLCPLGAIFSMLSISKIFKVHKYTSNCGNCRACKMKCPMAIELDQMDGVDSGECIQCFNCVNVCPSKNAQAKVLDIEVNEKAVAAALIATTVGVYSLANLNNVKTTANSTLNIQINSTNTAETKTSSTNNTTSNTTTSGTQKSSSTTSSNTTTPKSGSTVTNTNTNTTTTTTSSTVKYKDGVYTGTGRGYHPGLTVSVTIKNNKITSVELVSINETPGFYERAAEIVPEEIVTKQSTTVNVVSGATRTSNGIIQAVKAALEKAKI